MGRSGAQGHGGQPARSDGSQLEKLPRPESVVTLEVEEAVAFVDLLEDLRNLMHAVSLGYYKLTPLEAQGYRRRIEQLLRP